ncbi:hypothetical protein PLESTM_000922200 [Pleodorina starrii]|nr:hypothetical protein PLESTM_000922200 [Pleodorina starrii]
MPKGGDCDNSVFDEDVAAYFCENPHLEPADADTSSCNSDSSSSSFCVSCFSSTALSSATDNTPTALNSTKRWRLHLELIFPPAEALPPSVLLASPCGARDPADRTFPKITVENAQEVLAADDDLDEENEIDEEILGLVARMHAIHADWAVAGSEEDALHWALIQADGDKVDPRPAPQEPHKADEEEQQGPLGHVAVEGPTTVQQPEVCEEDEDGERDEEDVQCNVEKLVALLQRRDGAITAQQPQRQRGLLEAAEEETEELAVCSSPRNGNNAAAGGNSSGSSSSRTKRTAKSTARKLGSKIASRVKAAFRACLPCL